MAAMVAGPFPALTSAGGVIALLDEPAADLQTRALERLNDMVHEFWPEISGSIGKIEQLFEDEGFQSQKLAALVASKVFYHLGEYDDALTFALGASDLFDVAEESQYVNTMISKCIDKYIQLSITEGAEIGVRLMDIVDRMFQNCFDQGNYKQAVGIGLEARNLQRVEQAIRLSENMAPMLNYCYEVIQSVAMTLAFRRESLQLLVSLYKEVGGNSSSGVDYFAICQCLLLLKDHESVAEILAKLARGSLEDTLLAYQVAFDLSDNGAHHFMERVSAKLPVPAPPAAPAAEAGADAAPDAMDTEADSEFTPELTERLDKLRQILSSETMVRLHLEFMFRNNNTDLLLLKQIKDSIEPRNSIGHNATVFANALMHCGTTVDSFLRENIDWLKRSTNWAKFSATACVGTIHRGHIDKGKAVLQDYLPGSGATGGSPYLEGGALYALGIINAGHGDAVKPFLVEQLEGAGGTGAEVLHHGACLGLGLAAMASGDVALAEQVKDTVLLKWLNTVSGEAAGYAIGLIMLGSGQCQLLEDLYEFAKECAHEKITRGVAMGMAMMVYGCEEDAETLIEQLAREPDHILRYGAMFATGLAYAGTSNNKAISRLLHVAVSDVSEDVKRAAVMNLGFVMSNKPEQVPRTVNLLAESYSPHVRYGSVMAVGFACAGTGSKKAIELLWKLTKDSVDFVRQGAFIALAMVLIQRSEMQEPKVKEFRETTEKIVADKHEDSMTKFGCIIAIGIINAGGCNSTLGLHAPSGHKKMSSFIGFAMFSQYWYWYPLIPMLSIALSPTSMICLNSKLEMPKGNLTSNAKPAMFAYPPKKELKKKSTGPAVATAVLSITDKAKARALKRDKSKAKDMEVDKPSEEPKTEAAPGEDDAAEKLKTERTEKAKEMFAAADKSKDESLSKSEMKKFANSEEGAELKSLFDGDNRGWNGLWEVLDKNKDGKFSKDEFVAAYLDACEEGIAMEAAFVTLENPARVTYAQREFIQFDENSRYSPIVSNSRLRGSGIIMMSDATPDEEAEIVKPKASEGLPEDEGEEPEPPAPFEYAEYM